MGCHDRSCATEPRATKRLMGNAGHQVLQKFNGGFARIQRNAVGRATSHCSCLILAVIGQPDGCRLLLPAWMTESWATALPTVDVPRLKPLSRAAAPMIASECADSAGRGRVTQIHVITAPACRSGTAW